MTTAATEGYWFRSTRFRIEPDEDMDANPGIYGRQLAYWLRDQLAPQGWPDAQVIAEDFGWCVMCRQRPFRAWVGCGGVVAGDEAAPRRSDALADDALLPSRPGQVPMLTDSVVWHCFVQAECSWLGRMRGQGSAAAAERQRLDAAVRALLTRDPQIQLVDD